MLLFCVKHTRLDIMNPARELSKMLGIATVAAMKEMRCIIKHVLDTMSLGLKMEPKLGEDGKWIIKAHSDSDWAGDPEDRKSVGCYIILVNGVPVAWRAKSQKCVQLNCSGCTFHPSLVP